MATTAVPSAELTPEQTGADDPSILSQDHIREVLVNGELDILGRLTDASNVTVLGRSTLAGVSLDCVYKPIRGERPLWDFPDGSLAAREVASAMISRCAGWNCVPPTYLRTAAIGPGMVQLWINDADPETMINLFAADEVPADWLPVLRARDSHGEPMILAHADRPELAVLAGFDLVVNNADRKAPHVLPTAAGQVYGVDHGLTLHRQDKLRTVLWGWAGAPLPAAGLAGLQVLSEKLVAGLGADLAELITRTELKALSARVERLVTTGTFGLPPEDRSPIPWPPL